MRIISKVIFTLLLSSVVCSVFARGGDRHWTVKCDKDQKGYSMTGKAGSGDYTCLPKKKLWIFPEKDSYVTATCAAPAPNGHAGEVPKAYVYISKASGAVRCVLDDWDKVEKGSVMIRCDTTHNIPVTKRRHFTVTQITCCYSAWCKEGNHNIK